MVPAMPRARARARGASHAPAHVNRGAGRVISSVHVLLALLLAAHVLVRGAGAFSDGAGSCDKVGHGKKAEGDGGYALLLTGKALVLSGPPFKGFIIRTNDASLHVPKDHDLAKAMNVHISKTCKELGENLNAITHKNSRAKTSVSMGFDMPAGKGSASVVALVSESYNVWYELTATLQEAGAGAAQTGDADRAWQALATSRRRQRVLLRNRSPERMELLWDDGKEGLLQGEVLPGGEMAQMTYPGHSFIWQRPGAASLPAGNTVVPDHLRIIIEPEQVEYDYHGRGEL